METIPLLPDSSALHLERVSVALGVAEIIVSSARPMGHCPRCGMPAARVHSRYERTLQDLPWQGTRVKIRWRSRKFFCDTPGCEQRIFTERLPTITWRYGRRTVRCRDAVLCLGLTLGGEEGSRVANYLGLSLSGDTLLREIRNAPRVPFDEPHVIGVDDWALRRGHEYGTLIVDLERHRPLDLLPGRTWEVFSDWLAQHPSVEVVSRDRAECYAHGANAGAPQASHVADRWHLLQNLREALKNASERYSPEIRQAVEELAAPAPAAPPPTATSPGANNSSPTPLKPTHATSKREMRRSRRVERYQRVHEMHALGRSQSDIARMLGLDRKTVRRFLRSETFPERAARRTVIRKAPLDAYLERRWAEGLHNARKLTAELTDLGHVVSYYSIRRKVAPWRHDGSLPQTAPGTGGHGAIAKNKTPSSHQMSWLLFLSPDELEAKDRLLVEAVKRRSPSLNIACELAGEFIAMVKQRRGEKLDDWIARARAPRVPLEIQRFARGLLSERAAIEAALTLPWSNGQAEGQINRLKLIKRQMYGRAKLDLLGQRFLGRAALAPLMKKGRFNSSGHRNHCGSPL